jgi:transglutaminase-like putative cysteine protease
VFDVQASRPDYWKTENLEVFNGSAWTGQSPQSSSPQYTVAEAHLRRWTQTLRVTLRAMKTSDVIGAGVAGPPSHLLGAMEGFSDGTWADPSGLGPGDSYEITAYEPQPSSAQLQAAGTRYPGVLFPNYVSINIPSAEIPQAAGYAPGTQRPFTSVVFPPFGSRRAPSYSAIAGDPAAQLVRSPYARAYELALRLERRAATPYAYAMSVKNYLDSGSYKYNENPPRSRYPLATFLFSSKRGYCQQFAGTMALLLRMGGVPARVAVGFTPGTYNTATRSWVVTDTDAHAWTEAWFPSYGWVRFDPTPAAAPARGGHAPLPAIKGATVTAPRVRTPRGQSGGAAGIAAPAPHHGTGFPIAIVLAGVIGLALVGLAVASTVRLRGPTDEELLAELERAFIRCGREVQSGITLAGLEQRLRGSPEAQAYVRALRLCRFAGARELPSAAQRRALRSQLRAGLGITGLLRAMWALPPRLVLRLPGLRPSEGS